MQNEKEVVVKIPEEVYKYIMKLQLRNMAEEYIAEGTPLKEGHWIEVDNGYICSECDIIRAKGTTGKYNYCPNCGAKMKREG